MASRQSAFENVEDDRIRSFIDALENPANLRTRSMLWLRNSILVFENKYGMKSADMVAGVESGQIEETDDICSWLLKVDLLRDAEAEIRP